MVKALKQAYIGTTTDDIIALASTTAMKYGISPEIMEKVIFCESSWKTDAIGDNGESIGLAQIHLTDHPDITKEQAFDPFFSIDWMASEMSKGRSKEWSCYRKLYQS